jgi:hypothetical protein
MLRLDGAIGDVDDDNRDVQFIDEGRGRGVNECMVLKRE